eukprot:EG_transcript_10334
MYHTQGVAPPGPAASATPRPRHPLAGVVVMGFLLLLTYFAIQPLDLLEDSATNRHVHAKQKAGEAAFSKISHTSHGDWTSGHAISVHHSGASPTRSTSLFAVSSEKPLPSTMRAAVYDFSKPGNVIRVVDDYPTPAADPNSPDLLVRTLAAAVNPIDYKLPGFSMMRFKLDKKVIGLDICAEVLEDKAGFRKGDVVFGFAAGGALAQYTTVRPTAVVRKPEGLSVVEAAGIGVAYVTSLMACQAANVRPGDRVAVLGASGGCGSAAVQIARALGARSVLAVCSRKNTAFVTGLGATDCLNYNAYNGDLAALGSAGPNGTLDSVIDTVSSPDDPNYEKVARRWLRPGGAYVALNSPSVVDWVRKLVLPAWQRPNYQLILAETKESAPYLQRLSDLITQGDLRVVVHQQSAFSAEGVAAAFREQRSRRATGKIVLTFDSKPSH